MLSMVKLIMHRHVRIACFRFPFVHVAHITSHLLIGFFPEFTHLSCRRYHRVDLRPSIFDTTCCPLSFVHDKAKLLAEHVEHVHNSSNSQRNNNPNPSHTHRHHCERCYDYDPHQVSPDRCHSLYRVRHR
jgi:hypothetical protein